MHTQVDEKKSFLEHERVKKFVAVPSNPPS